MTEFQKGWRWNPIKMNWVTIEDTVETDIVINPRLKKYTANEFISKMPQQFRSLKLTNRNDVMMIVATCSEPVRIFSLINRLGTSNRWGHKRNPTDAKSTPFHLTEVENCRNIMLQLSDASHTNAEINNIKEAKRVHLRKVH